MQSPIIPSGITGVTPTWLTSVLRESGALGPDGKAVILQPVQIGQGVGIMGEIHRVALMYEGDAGDAPESVVVKLPSTFAENREQGVNLGMYEAEVRFYDELAERTAAGLPTIHMSKIESGTAEFAIVMEDLSHLELIDQTDGMDPAQARAALHVLADIHAAWWDKVQTAELEWIPSMVGPRIEMVDQMLGQVWPLFVERFADRLPDGGVEVGAEFSQNYLRLNRKLADRAPWTLAHQDYRVENLMFGDPSEDEVVVIDWQGLGRGPGAYDVAYLLGGSMDTELRREHEADLVDAYHARLAANGIDDYPLDQARADYAFAHCLGGLATSIFAGATLDLSNERGYELLSTMSNRHFQAAIDHGGLELME